MADDPQANKRNARAFYETAYRGDPSGAAARCVGDDCTQHNPAVGDGKQAFIDQFQEMARDYPGKSIAFVRAVAEGALVALRIHQAWPGGKEYLATDFFRFDENGRIVEHRDASQQIPETSANGYPMYRARTGCLQDARRRGLQGAATKDMRA